MPLRNMFVLLGAAMLSLLCYERAARNRYISTLAEALHLIDKSYVEEVDSRVLFEGAINGMIDKLDSNSGYISPEKYRSFKAELDQEFGGIGRG